MDPQHILIISYVFPPFKGIGGRRWGKFAKYLARKGHHIHVVHCQPAHQDLGSPWEMDVQHQLIHTYPLPKNYPSVLSKRPLTSIWDKLTYRYWQRKLSDRTKGNILDKCILWEKNLLSQCRELISKYEIKNIIVTGAPFRLLFFATQLKTQGINLVADFRDPWTWADVYGYATLSKERMAYEKYMEKKVVETCDKILSPAPAILQYLRNAYPNVDESRFLRIAHAFDRDDMSGEVQLKVPGKKVRFIYAGSMYGAEEAETYFKELMCAFSNIREKIPELLEQFKFDLYITGHGIFQYEAMIVEHGLEDKVEFHNPLPASEVFTELMKSDYVLIFIPSINRDFMGTKFSEIFCLGVPVLHVGPKGFVSQFIRQHQTGYSMRVSELEEKLTWVLKERPRPNVDHGLIKDLFDIERITDQLERDVLKV